MTQRSCCVPNCLVKRGDDVLHHFPNPSNPAQIERFRTWVMKVGGDIIREQNNYIYKNRRVCHRHFEEVYTFPNKKLSALAIPSLHIPGVHAGPHTVIVQRATVMQSTINEDATMSLNPGVHADPHGVMVQQATVMQSTTDKDATMSLNPGYRKNAKPATALEKELKNIITKTKLKLRKCQSIRRKLKIQMEMAANFTKSSGYSILKDKMSPAAQTFFNMQLNEFGKKPTGRRFTLDEKILCLSLYKPCPKAYRLLGQLCVLPKRKTLDTLLNKIRLSPGMNDIIFHHLKNRVEKMPAAHKYCCVIFDEMAISPNLYYDKSKDIIQGFTDNGVERYKTFCDHVCVFMIRGVLKKFKQPLAFTFCKGSTKSLELSIFLKNIISKITDCGMNVVATVCDQGASNMAALNILMNATKADFIKDGKNYTGGYFIINTKKIYVIYDPPHLIKGIRNNLLNKDLVFKEDGKIKRASWSHVEALYQKAPGYRGVSLVNKLTAQHVIPSCIPKMRVKHCTQVFSERVGRTMGFMAEFGSLPNGSKDTADLLLFFDKLFDSVNGSYHKPDVGKIYRSAVTPRSPHRRLWYRCLPILKSMEFVTKSGRKGTVPSVTSWVKSIEAFIALTKDLHSAGLKSILLRNINQDPLENFFGSVRAHGLRNIMPSANAFINSYKSLLVSNITSNKSVGANCEADNLELLHSLKCLIVNSDPQKLIIEKEIEINNDHLCILETDVEDLIRHPNNKEKCAAVAYCSGWLIHILKKKIYKDCETCRRDLESESIQDFHKYIQIREYNASKSWLCYPTRESLAYFFNVENIVIEVLKTDCNRKQIFQYIELIVLMNQNFNFVTCLAHKSEIIKIMVRKSILFFINNWCKDINQLLSGKTTFCDDSDLMKVSARNYNLSHRRK